MSKNENRKAIVCLSGGQDSTTCMYWALREFDEVHAVCFDYNQRHSEEVEVARELAKNAGVSFKVLDMSLLNTLTVNALTRDDITVDSAKPENALPNTFVPGRNMLFLTFVAVEAYRIGAKHIVTGVGEADFSGYPDCRDTFIKSLNVSLNLAMDYQFEIHTPLMWLSKEQTWKLADDLGVFDIIRYQTLTCYNGIKAEGCGHCPACRLRNEGLKNYLAHKAEK